MITFVASHFLLIITSGPELQDFDEEDIEKVQKNNTYVWQFLAQQHKDVDKALEMMVGRNYLLFFK